MLTLNLCVVTSFLLCVNSEIINIRGRNTRNGSCGIDNSPNTVVYEGLARIESYPWMGYLIYPHKTVQNSTTTTVILVTKQLVIGAAMDIFELPKTDFRTRSKVILGQNCSSGPGIGVLDYNYHIDYKSVTNSALVLIQLDLSYLATGVLRPICFPPNIFEEKFHAMVLSKDCLNSALEIYEMSAVPLNQCRNYYRRSGLDIENIWPKHPACGKAWWGGECVWRNGAALVVKQNGRWHLLGFGVHGPGCQAPSRFLDYGMYRHWVATSVKRMGKPAITRLASNYLIFRRTKHIQRFGPCDPEELKLEINRDRTELPLPDPDKAHGFIRYNLTILANIEYHCILLRADLKSESSEVLTYKQPTIQLKRYCVSPWPICYQEGLTKMDYHVEITFQHSITFKVTFYGREMTVLDIKSLMKYTNEKHPFPPIPKSNKLWLLK